MAGSARGSKMYFDVVSTAPRTGRELSEEKQLHLLLLFIAFMGAIVSQGILDCQGAAPKINKGGILYMISHNVTLILGYHKGIKAVRGIDKAYALVYN